jgi:hypothetical protein
MYLFIYNFFWIKKIFRYHWIYGTWNEEIYSELRGRDIWGFEEECRKGRYLFFGYNCFDFIISQC